MTHEEFAHLTGLNVTESEFENINRAYMAAGEMDKMTFCTDWKATPLDKSLIASALTAEVENLNIALSNANKCYERAEQSLRDFTRNMADFLIIQAEKWSASDLRTEAIKLVGEKDYLRRKLKMKFNLWDEDIKLALKYLFWDEDIKLALKYLKD